jgi:hypothetical protein
MGQTDLFLYSIKRIWIINGEADEDDLRAWVFEWLQTLELICACCVPHGEPYYFSIPVFV